MIKYGNWCQTSWNEETRTLTIKCKCGKIHEGTEHEQIFK